MKKLFLALAMCLGIAAVTGCAEGVVYADPPVPPTAYATGTVEFCDDYGCRYVTAPYYYYDGAVVYWDVHFGCWIGPHGYWLGGGWHPGWVPGYHAWYGAHFYHGWHASGGHWGGGGHFGGHFGGGHGGGHR